ncbi:MAG TPA: hypothetical protein VI997_04510 [Candidatus Thermoplasmatota archaeon]|nr:hypothetical protein [Candidatus Thermoplasmatota archaeon]
MRWTKLSGGQAKGMSAVLAALAVAAAVTAAIYPWMEVRGSGASVWSTWDQVMDRPVADLLSLAMLPVAALVVGFVLVLTGLAGKSRNTRVGAILLLAAAPLYYVGVIQEAGRHATIAAGFWLVLLAAGLAFAAAQTSPTRG